MRVSRVIVGGSIPVIMGIVFSVGCSSFEKYSGDRSPAAAKVTETSLAGTRVSPTRTDDDDPFEVKFVNMESVRELCADGGKALQDGKDFSVREVNLNRADDRVWVRQQLDGLADLIKGQKKSEAKKGNRQCRANKGMAKALDEVNRLWSHAFDSGADATTQLDARMHVAVLLDAINNQFRYPIPKKQEILFAPFSVADRLSNTAGGSHRGYARNVPGVSSSKVSDGGANSPEKSTFWTRQNDISKKDLYVGFGRTAPVVKSGDTCLYDEPKSGYGIHGGFDAKCNGQKVKIRFGNEVNSGPFNARIFWALGYNVPSFDFVENLRIKYDRKIFTEYNKRADVRFGLSLLGFRVGEIEIQEYIDPMEVVRAVELRDGTRLTRAQFKEKYFRSLSSPEGKPELIEGNINDDFEKQIAYVITGPTGVKQMTEDGDELGPWDWNSVDYNYRREFRGAGLIGAWVGWYDCRFDNNELVMVKKDGGGRELKHYITDLGSALGNSSGFLSYSNSDANGFEWHLIAPKESGRGADSGGPSSEYGHGWGNSVAFKGYTCIDRNRSFFDMGTDDSKWILRQLAQLTDEQITQALVSTGLSSAQVRLLLDKLRYRRSAMIKAFGLESEFPQLRNNSINFEYANPKNPKYDYDPKHHGLIQAKVNGKVVAEAPDKGHVIIDGIACHRDNVVNRKCTVPLPAERDLAQ